MNVVGTLKRKTITIDYLATDAGTGEEVTKKMNVTQIREDVSDADLFAGVKAMCNLLTITVATIHVKNDSVLTGE